ncbi:MAG TPA: acyltransferase [Puia sp.]|uniref:acyltransferase family protein n=1 Tax=Puia sp. TaxID=2045100 RepID=UPI002CA99AA1|nr:acyltransferase [Puia sp.]HVU98972.1 acyltransferase [Puia sp.]
MGTNEKYMIQLDGLRFLAVVAVMFGHWTGDVPALAGLDFIAGTAGVNLFFVLSGFLISQILMVNKSENRSLGEVLKNFYARRFLRIFPLYYLVIGLSALLHIPKARLFFPYLVKYTFNYPTGLLRAATGNMAHLWSLSVEEQFYIFFPFVILLIPEKLQLRFFYLLILISMAFRVLCSLMFEHPGVAQWVSYSFTPGCFDCFALGAILAYYKLNDPAKLQRLLGQRLIVYVAALTSIALYVLVAYRPNNLLTMVFGRTMMAIFFFWLVGMAGLGKFKAGFGRFIQWKPVVYLGKISYGLYVYHYFMPWAFGHFHLEHPQIYYLPATILIATISWYSFELPFNDLKRFFAYEKKRQVAKVVV